MTKVLAILNVCLAIKIILAGKKIYDMSEHNKIIYGKNIISLDNDKDKYYVDYNGERRYIKSGKITLTKILLTCEEIEDIIEINRITKRIGIRHK